MCCVLLDSKPNDAPSCVYADTSTSAGLFVCCCLSGLCCPHRDISKLALFNVLGVGAVVLLGAAAGLLGVVAVVNGTAFAPPAGECGCCWVHGYELAWLANLRLALMVSHEQQPWLLLLLFIPPVCPQRPTLLRLAPLSSRC